jgi:hypothetical protein
MKPVLVGRPYTRHQFRPLLQYGFDFAHINAAGVPSGCEASPCLKRFAEQVTQALHLSNVNVMSAETLVLDRVNRPFLSQPCRVPPAASSVVVRASSEQVPAPYEEPDTAKEAIKLGLTLCQQQR